jgi:hypothetical protein
MARIDKALDRLMGANPKRIEVTKSKWVPSGGYKIWGADDTFLLLFLIVLCVGVVVLD